MYSLPLIFVAPRVRAWLGLPTVRVYQDVTLSHCDAVRDLRPLTPAYIDGHRKALYPAKMAYVLAMKQGAGPQTIGTLLVLYLTLALRANRPDLVRYYRVPMLGLAMKAMRPAARKEVVDLLTEGTQWYRRGTPPAWLIRPKTPKKNAV